MDATNVTAGAFSNASISHRENLNGVLTSDKLKKLDEIVNAINNLTINDALYELSTTTASDTQGDLTRDPDTSNHTSNGVLDRKLLSCWTIREVYVLSLPEKPNIHVIILVPQTLLTPAVNEIFADATSSNA